MIAAMADIRTDCQCILGEIDLGGGHAVPYATGEVELDLDGLALALEDALDAACAAERFPRPRVVVEPGRAISARAGVTLYRVCAVTRRLNGPTIVAVDGGLSDNPQAGFVGANYTVAVANRHSIGPSGKATVVGRHGESGDVIARDIDLPADVHPGDLLAVACTGAYHHSMASTYSMVGRPAVVAVQGGRARELIRRETTADLLARDRG
jgi:diaminopimelate decarboxylase